MKITLGKFIVLVVLACLSVFTFNTYAQWKCYAVDRRGHYWMSAGSTAERATIVALSFCSAYSPSPDSCHKDKCIEKQV